MGCAVSKLDNEDTVRRCKERRHLMKEAVYARHNLAAAHADYLFSLRRTGSALSSFAEGEHLAVSHDARPVFLHPPIPTTTPLPPRVPSPSPSPPPPPQQLPRTPMMKNPMPMPMPNNPKPKPKPKSKPRLPHILSESSFSNSPRSGFFPTAYQANSTYSSTPSQTSSVWNWENYYPPSPPDSEFFDQHNTNTHFFNQQQGHHLDDDEEEEEREEKATQYDFFENRENRKNRKEEEETEDETDVVTEAEREREEVQCSEWDRDHYNTTSSSEEEEEVEGEDGDLRSEIGTRSNFGGSMAPPAPPMANSEDAGSSAGSYRTREIWSENMKVVVRHKDLKEIVAAIKENFEKAAGAGDKVSEMLEIGRAQLDRSFRQLKSEREFPYCVFLNLFCFEGVVWLLRKCWNCSGSKFSSSRSELG